MKAAALALALAATWPHAAAAEALRLAVPAVRQAPERCGPAALEMVLRYYGAGEEAVAEAGRAYSPVLRGALVTDLAAAARRAGFAARVATLEEDSLAALLRAGVPPVLLYQTRAGPLAPLHYGVVVGWDPASGRYALNDGRVAGRQVKRQDLVRRWRAAGGQVLVVWREGS